MASYNSILRHVSMADVKRNTWKLRKQQEDESARQIALQEQQYLLHFVHNTVPKHYDWRTGKFNTNSIKEVNKLVLKRLEDIDDVLSEGMTSKGFEYLYGGIVTYDIVSLNPTLVSSTFAQDLISASSEVTSHMFGPDFPGSHINSIGDYKVDSYTKVNVNAYYDSTFGSASGYGNSFTLNTVDGPSGASRSSLESALGITLPNGITRIFGGTPIEGSAVQRTFTGAKPGNVINFNWGFSSTEKGLDPSFQVDDYAFVAISGRATKFVSILQNGEVDGGAFRYRLQPSDIDAYGNVRVSIGVIDVYDRLYNTTLRVSNFGSLYAGDIGSIGDTTDAADLGMPVKPPKKKGDDDLIAAHDKPFSKYPPAGGDDKWPGLPQDSIKDYLHPSKDPLLNIPITPFGLPPDWKAKGGKGTQIAAGGNPRNTGGSSSGDPENIQWPRNKYPNKKAPPGPGYRPPTAKKKQTTMVAHYEPQGEVLSEKKRLKSVKDIGNYPGKPSPLGFPEEEPPKMVNGYHPNLVDGKEVSQRFNRLDPISARAMPLTGNPHIDKKVRASAKKPK